MVLYVGIHSLCESQTDNCLRIGIWNTKAMLDKLVTEVGGDVSLYMSYLSFPSRPFPILRPGFGMKQDKEASENQAYFPYNTPTYCNYEFR